MPPKNKFIEGEKVLCYHGPLIYEAKCLKYTVKDNQLKYYIHYTGWNKNWDEWVPEDRVLKFNEANLQKQKDKKKTMETKSANKKSTTTSKGQNRKSDGIKEKDKESNSRASTPNSLIERTPSRASKSIGSIGTPTSLQDSFQDTSRRRRGRPETSSSDTDEPTVKGEFKITLPDELKYHLAHECDIITKQKKLPTLPMGLTVDKLLDCYIETVEDDKETGINRDSALEVTKGIKEYFNMVINLQLLYKWERPYFEEMVPEDSTVAPSELYGPYYLLRLFVKLGDLLSYTYLDDKSRQLLQIHFTHLIQYLQNNSSSIFDLKDYKDASLEYQKKYSNSK